MDVFITRYADKLNELGEILENVWILFGIIESMDNASIRFYNLFLELLSVILSFSVIRCCKLNRSSERFVENSYQPVEIWLSEFFCRQEDVTNTTEDIELCISVKLRRFKDIKEL